MTLADLYVDRPGWLHRIDPRVKVGLVIAIWVILFIDSSLDRQILGFTLLLLAHLSSGITVRQLARYLLALLPVSILMALLRGLFIPAGPLLYEIGPLQVTTQGMSSGVAVGVRLLSMALSVLLLLSTTESRDLTRALVALGLPYDWGMSLALALRFLPEFIVTYQTVRQGMQSRALDFNRGSPWVRLEKLSPVMISVIVSSLRRSEQMAIALEARAFAPRAVARTDLHPLRMKVRDWVLLGCVLGGTLGALVLKLS